MKSRFLSWLALAWVAALSSGCYTVMVAPFSSSGLSDDSRLSAAAARQEDRKDESRLGRFEDEGSSARSWYGGGYGYGYPVYGAGYDSQYGGYGIAPYGYGPYYGYGYNPYGGGYGPYGYGYDPYYRSSSGVYIPPGYELVTTGELDALRSAGRGGLATTPVQSATEKEAARKAEARKQQEVWQRRVDPQERPAPVVTPRPAEAPAGSSSSSGSSGNTSKPASSSTESAGPKKVRR